MARRYTRREFVYDALFMLGSTILLHLIAPPVLGNTPPEEPNNRDRALPSSPSATPATNSAEHSMR